MHEHGAVEARAENYNINTNSYQENTIGPSIAPVALRGANSTYARSLLSLLYFTAVAVELLLMLSGRCLILPVFLLAALWPMATLAEPIFYSEQPASDHSEATVSKVRTSVYSGLAEFPDIQVPTTENSEENLSLGQKPPTGQHRGVAIGLNLSYGIAASQLNPTIFIDLTRIATLEAERETFAASYNRLALGGGISYQLGIGWLQQIGIETSIRRTIFKNVSSGHYVDTAMPRLNLTGDITPNIYWNAHAGHSLVSRFGYNSGDASKSGAFPSSSAKLKEGGVSAGYRLDQRAHVSLGYEVEQTTIQMNDVSQYSRYGLTIADSAPKQQNLNLNTALFKIGLHTNW